MWGHAFGVDLLLLHAWRSLSVQEQADLKLYKDYQRKLAPREDVDA